MAELFWLSDEPWAAIEPLLPKNQPGARRVDDRRVISGILHVLKTGCRWCDCPADVRSARRRSTTASTAGRGGASGELLDALVKAGGWAKHRDRQHLHQGAALGVRRKRGARAQAIGRSRGGQTTKVHALTDVIGRPCALMLTPGNVGDVTAAPALLEAPGRMRLCSPTRAMTPTGCAADCAKSGTVPVIPGKRNRKRTIRYDQAPLPRAPPRSRTPSAASRTSAASPPATTSSPPTSSQPSRSPPPSPSGADRVQTLAPAMIVA